MRILYEVGERPRPLETEVGEEVYNQHDGILYTKNKFGDIITVSHNFQPKPSSPISKPTANNLPVVPIGGIIMYHGAYSKIPTNFALCDGKGITPDLRGKFIDGANDESDVGHSGGTADAVVVSHTHTGNTGDQSASHHHNMSHGTHINTVREGVSSSTAKAEVVRTDTVPGSSLVTANQSSSHHHAFTTDDAGVSGTGKNLPPYYKLAYIMRVR